MPDILLSEHLLSIVTQDGAGLSIDMALALGYDTLPLQGSSQSYGSVFALHGS